MAQSANFQTTRNWLNGPMAEENPVANIDATASDGNPVFTPRQCLKRFRPFTKWEHENDNASLLK